MTQQEFNRIKSGEQTILLMKISTPLFVNKDNGRIEFAHRIENSHIKKDCCKILKTTINGYSIIKNPFKEKLAINGFNVDIMNTFTYDVRKKLNNLFNLNFDETNWMITDWDKLKQQFQNEDEILVLQIESVE